MSKVWGSSSEAELTRIPFSKVKKKKSLTLGFHFGRVWTSQFRSHTSIRFGTRLGSREISLSGPQNVTRVHKEPHSRVLIVFHYSLNKQPILLFIGCSSSW